MNASVTLGRVWGIRIGLHWSLLIVFALLTFSLAGAYLPGEYPDLPRNGRFVAAIVTAVLFFASILLHELGHAWVALREGIPVNGITLFVFGGVAEIGAPAKTPGAEFRIAVGGPVVSLILALLFGGLGLLGLGPWVDAPADWLARINAMLLLFNLIPGYPLDGGRMLRAAVWHFSRNERTGWRVAMISGQIVSFGLIGVGGYMAFTGNFANGIWLIFIGWFLQNATVAEQTAATVQNQLAGTTVGQAASLTEEPRVPSRLHLRQLVDDHVLSSGQNYFLVVDDGTPRGVVTLNDVTKVPRDKWDWTTVGEIMTPWARMERVGPKTELLAALRLMEGSGTSHLPVCDGDRVVGLLTREEVIRFLRLRAELGLQQQGP